MKRGKLITFEGPEGSGKSTQSALLCKFLMSKGYRVLRVREPGGTKISEKIRSILLDTKNRQLFPEAELLLYLASRAQLINEIIKPALKKGKVVISDRFSDATVCYQGYGLGLNIDMIKKMDAFARDGITPDVTILLDIPTKKGLKKSFDAKHYKDRIEKRAVNFHKKVRLGYLKLARQNPKRIKLIRLKDDILKTQGLIRKEILKILKKT